jgi:hypothetical protein
MVDQTYAGMVDPSEVAKDSTTGYGLFGIDKDVYDAAMGVYRSAIQPQQKVIEEYQKGERDATELARGMTAKGINAVEDLIFNTVTLPFNNRFTQMGYQALPELGMTEAAGKAAEDVGMLTKEFLDDAKLLGPIQNFLRENPSYLRDLDERATVAGAINPVRSLITLISRKTGLDDAALRGYFLGEGEVIVPNFYGPRTDKYTPIEEEFIQKLFKDEAWDDNKSFDDNWNNLLQNPMLQNQDQNVLRQGYGFIKWGARGANRVLKNLYSAKNKALYAEHGVAPVAKEQIDLMEQTIRDMDAIQARKPPESASKEVKKSWSQEFGRAQNRYKRQVEIAHSQIQALANIRTQAGAKARKEDLTYNFALEASDPNSPGIYFRPDQLGSDWLHQSTKNGGNVPGKEVPAEQSAMAQSLMLDAWKDLDQERMRVIVKKPMSNVTGAHFLDVVDKGGFAGPVKGQIFDVFDPKKAGDTAINEMSTVADLENALRKRAELQTGSRKGKKRPDVDFVVKGSDSTGVYVMVSRNQRKGGRGKVEGGINMIIKVEPNGDITGYMSDLHDFLEKTPIGPVLERALPTQVFAVSPPMQSNVFSIITKERLESRGFADKPRVARPQAPVGEYEDAVQRLREYNQAQPSLLERVRQMPDVALNITTTANIMRDDSPVGVDLDTPKKERMFGVDYEKGQTLEGLLFSP